MPGKQKSVNQEREELEMGWQLKRAGSTKGCEDGGI